MTIKIKTSAELQETLNEYFIKLHDDFLAEDKESVFDWYFEPVSKNLVQCTISYTNLSKDSVQYVMETLEMLERNING